MDILLFRVPLGFGNRHTDKSMEVGRRTCLNKKRISGLIGYYEGLNILLSWESRCRMSENERESCLDNC